jgi:hypothetical protein
MSKQTAVQWLLNNLLINGLLRLTKDEHPLYKELKDHAKSMEKEQITIAYQSDRTPCSDEDAEQYYNETYGGYK